MKRMAALFAVTAAITGVVPASASAATVSDGPRDALCLILAVRLCEK